MATLSSPDLLYIIHGNGYFSQAVGDTSGSQQVMVDGCRSKLVNVISGVRHCFGPVIVSPVHVRAFFILENKLIGYTDDSILMAFVPSPGIRVAVAESLIRDLGRVSVLVSGVTFGG